MMEIKKKPEKYECIWVLRKLPVATSALATVHKAGDYRDNNKNVIKSVLKTLDFCQFCNSA